MINQQTAGQTGIVINEASVEILFGDSGIMSKRSVDNFNVAFTKTMVLVHPSPMSLNTMWWKQMFLPKGARNELKTRCA